MSNVYLKPMSTDAHIVLGQMLLNQKHLQERKSYEELAAIAQEVADEFRRLGVEE